MEAFEKQVKGYGCEIKVEKVCEHEIGNVVYYKAEEAWGEVDDNVYKRVGCEGCVRDSLDNLSHGGHFRSIIMYDKNIVVQTAGEPFATPEKKRIKAIESIMEDMDLAELSKLLANAEEIHN